MVMNHTVKKKQLVVLAMSGVYNFPPMPYILVWQLMCYGPCIYQRETKLKDKRKAHVMNNRIHVEFVN